MPGGSARARARGGGGGEMGCGGGGGGEREGEREREKGGARAGGREGGRCRCLCHLRRQRPRRLRLVRASLAVASDIAIRPVPTRLLRSPHTPRTHYMPCVRACVHLPPLPRSLAPPPPPLSPFFSSLLFPLPRCLFIPHCRTSMVRQRARPVARRGAHSNLTRIRLRSDSDLNRI